MLVRALGLKEYTEVWKLQQELVEKRRTGEILDTLLLVEHEPVYTRGVSSKSAVPAALPYPLHSVERGGDVTYHGPGQLVGYPIIDLKAKGLRPRTYLRALEDVLIESLRPLGFQAEILRGFTGVWCQDKKIASIGVAIKNDISYHGFALNVNVDLEPFSRIHPCNLQPDEIGTLAGLSGQPLVAGDLMKPVAEAFLSYFGDRAAAAP